MGKIKLFLISLFVGFGLMVKPAYAIEPQVSIQKLPGFINYNTFKLSYSAISDDPSSIQAQFYYVKNGGPSTPFGGVISGASGQIQVDGSIVNDHTSYTFAVVVNTSPNKSDSTATTYDVNGPAPVSNYYKEHIGDGFNKLHWTNPPDTDFAQVVIYRGDTADFSADSGHEIARVAGSPNSNMTYDDHYSPDGNKTHYYNIRALDQAGNSSSLVGDGSTTTTTTTASPTPGAGGGTVQILPGEQGAGGGSVLSKETSAEPTAEPLVTTQAKATPFGLSRTRILGIGALAVVLGLVVYFFTRKRSY